MDKLFNIRLDINYRQKLLSVICSGLAIVLFTMLITPQLFAEDSDVLIRRASRYLEALPATMPGADKDTPAKVELGKKLFFDARLSINNKQSCSSCHHLDDGGAGIDNLPTSPGANGQIGTRNTPTVINAGWQVAQFWDGRSPDLAAQAKEPILNPIEMGMPSAQAVEQKLLTIPEYVSRFAAAFPQSKQAITYTNISEAIAAFERTLRSESRFDDFLNGHVNALSQGEQRGLKTFIKLNCVKCHDGPLVGGGSLEKLGEYGEYDNQADLGRYEVTKNEEDKMVFKVPSLRNVALTAPYFHDGRIATLSQAVRIIAKLQLNRDLEPDQVSDIVDFLNALSDKSKTGLRR